MNLTNNLSKNPYRSLSHFFLIFFLFLSFTTSIFALDFEAALLNDSKIATEILDQQRNETIYGRKYITVSDEFDFFMPYFEPGKDAELIREMEFGKSILGTIYSEKVAGDQFVLFYFGSTGFVDAYEEDFMRVRLIKVNSKSIDKYDKDFYGYKRMKYSDGSENLLIYVQVEDLNIGGWNKLTVSYDPRKTIEDAIYHEKFNLSIGRFYSVIDVDYNNTPIHKNSFNITFNMKNKGIAKQMEDVSFYIFFNESQIDANQVNISIVNQSDGISYQISKKYAELENMKSYHTITLSDIIFQDVNKKNITLSITLNLESKTNDGSSTVSIIPAYSYLDSNITQLDETFLSLHNCDEDRDCGGSNVCLQNICSLSKIHLVYVPVNWNPSAQELKEEINYDHEFLVYSLPSLKNCENKIKKTVINKTLQINNILSLNHSDVLDKIKKYVNLNYDGSYDYIVGIGNDNAFSDKIAGYTISESNVVFAKKDRKIVVAHEMGHQFGLNDEYCSCPGGGKCDEEPNPLKSELGCDVNGDCCWENFKLFGYKLWGDCCEPYGCTKCCKGNLNEKGGRSIMSSLDADGPRYHDKISLEYLSKNPNLRCD